MSSLTCSYRGSVCVFSLQYSYRRGVCVFGLNGLEFGEARDTGTDQLFGRVCSRIPVVQIDLDLAKRA